MGGMGGFGQRGPMSAEDMFDVFEQAFGGAGGPFGRRGPARGRDVQVEVQLDLFESASGVKRKVSWRSPSSGKAQEVEVQIPAGVDSGMNLRVNGQGEPGAGGQGHLYVMISVAEHAVFERDGADVHVKVRLSIAEAILGGKVVIPTL